MIFEQHPKTSSQLGNHMPQQSEDTYRGIPYFISLEEALKICYDNPISAEIEKVSIDDAHGRILAQDLESLVNDPPFDNSSMDGFALRYEDSKNPPNTLEMCGTIQAAADSGSVVVKPGQAARIMTGAPIPEGADSILMIEKCDIQGSVVTLNEEAKPHFIRKKGENLSLGKVALTKGTYLRPARVGLCATMGYPEIPVFRKLKVAIISTGDELKSPGEELEFGELYESNSYGLAGLVSWLGHEPVRMNSVSDTIESLRQALDEAAENCDLILTSGGVSMGDWDLVRKIMEEEGNLKFWRIKIRPGSPPLFGHWKNVPIFGLPGNPVSSHVVFRMLVAPFIRKSMHTQEPKELELTVTLQDKVKVVDKFLTLRRVTVHNTENGLIAMQPRHQGSGNLESLASGDALTLLGEGDSGEIGSECKVLILG